MARGDFQTIDVTYQLINLYINYSSFVNDNS